MRNASSFTKSLVGFVVVVFGLLISIPGTHGADVEFIEYHTVVAIEPARALIREGLTGTERWIEGDSIVTAWFGVASDGLLAELRLDHKIEAHAVGDCLAPRRAIDAIWDGFRVGVEI